MAFTPLPDVALNDPHVQAHNDERHAIDALQTSVDTNTASVASNLAAINDLKSKALQPDGSQADGQLLAWSATLGKWVPVNPTGSAEIGYAENSSGTVTPLSTTGGLGATQNITGCSLVIPPTTRPVWIHFAATFAQVGTAAPGAVYLEVQSGTTTLGNRVKNLPNSTLQTQYTGNLQGSFRLGPVAASTTLQLKAVLFTQTGVAANVNIFNGSANDSKSWIAAEVR